jgi:acyl carrier protein
MSTEMEISEAIKGFLLENFVFSAEFPIGDEDSLQDSGVIDSAGVLTLIVFLEERFGINVGEDDVRAQNMDSLGNLTRFVARKTASP